MKYSVAATALALASGVVAKPRITNSGAISPEEGKAFTLQLTGCSAGCTVYLMTGPKDEQVPARVLASSATTSAAIILSDLGSGSYSIRVKDNSATGAAGDLNDNNDYTGLFSYTGTGPTNLPPLSGSASAAPVNSAPASSVGSSAAAAATAATSGSPATSGTATATGSSAATASSPASSASSATASASKSAASAVTGKSSSAATGSATSTPPPSSGSMHVLSPVGLLGAAVAAALFL